MWKYLKDYVIGKLLDKWIITATASSTSTTNNNINGHFLYYRNASLNTVNLKFLLNFGFEIDSGSIEELAVDVNWMEIFRYWTEIKSKYHIEDGEEESEEEQDSMDIECSTITIRNLTLNLCKTSTKTPIIIQNQEQQDLPNDVNVDLMKDFLDHVIAQFKVLIEGVTINIDNTTIINIPNLLIAPETNGLRRITVTKEHVKMQSEGAGCLIVQKGTEMLITRTIEGIKIKFDIPGITVDMNNLNIMIQLFNLWYIKSSSASSTTANVCFEVALAMLKVDCGPLEVIINDIWLDSSAKDLLLGHCQAKWNKLLFLESPIQTHVVSGNFRDGLSVIVNEDLGIKLRDFDQINEIREYFENSESNNSKEEGRKSLMNLKLMGLNVIIQQDIQVDLRHITLANNELAIKSMDLEFFDSYMNISNFTYNFSCNQNSFTTSPFAEMKRFIENDEITSIEEYNKLYGQFQKNLSIANVQCAISVEDALRLVRLLSSRSRSTNASKESISVLFGAVDQLNLKVVLDECTYYTAQFANLSFLATESFLDFRGQLNCLQRVDLDLVRSAGVVNCTWTRELTVVEAVNLAISVPFNLKELMINDFERYMRHAIPESSVGTSRILQFTFKNLKAKLNPPSNVVEPIESEVCVKEANIKLGKVVYLDELELRLEDEAVFNSGLLKIELKPFVVNVWNHCSELDFTQEGYQKFLRFAQFWSEIYSPEIQEIEPEAIFHDEPEPESARIEDECTVKIVEMEEGGDEDSLELLFDLFDDDTADSTGEVKNVSLNDQMMMTEELLRDIDEDFFVKKQDQQSTESGALIKISNFGVKINLILSNNSKVCIALNGIDGSVTAAGNLNLKIKEGMVTNSQGKVLLNRWPRGPDVTCKHPIEDGNFLTLKARKISKDAVHVEGIDEFSLAISIGPLRLFLDQGTLNSLTSFFRNDNISNQQQAQKVVHSFIFFNKVTISPLALKLDYNPVSTGPIVPLQGAEMTLPRIGLRGVKGLEGLGPAVLAAWIPEMRGKKLTGALTTGLVPVRTVINLGGGVVELILLPWQLTTSNSAHQSQSAAHAVAQIRKSSKQIGLETLKLTASLASTTTKLLKPSDKLSSAYPRDFQSGIQQAAQLIIALPTRINQQTQKRGTLRAVPLLVLDSAAGVTGAVAKTLQGIQAEFDRELERERRIKRA